MLPGGVRGVVAKDGGGQRVARRQRRSCWRRSARSRCRGRPEAEGCARQNTDGRCGMQLASRRVPLLASPRSAHRPDARDTVPERVREAGAGAGAAHRRSQKCAPPSIAASLGIGDIAAPAVCRRIPHLYRRMMPAVRQADLHDRRRRQRRPGALARPRGRGHGHVGVAIGRLLKWRACEHRRGRRRHRSGQRRHPRDTAPFAPAQSA